MENNHSRDQKQNPSHVCVFYYCLFNIRLNLLEATCSIIHSKKTNDLAYFARMYNDKQLLIRGKEGCCFSLQTIKTILMSLTHFFPS